MRFCRFRACEGLELETVDLLLDCGKPPTQADRSSLAIGLARFPSLIGNAIEAGQRACTISSSSAVKENWIVGRIVQYLEILLDRVIGYFRPHCDAYRNVNVVHSQLLYDHFLIVFRPQIDNRLDSVFLQIHEPITPRLSSPI